MKTNLFNYFKSSWGLSSAFFLTIYVMLLIACIHDYIKGEVIGVMVMIVLTLIYIIVIGVDYLKWRKNSVVKEKEKIEFKGSTYDPRKK